MKTTILLANLAALGAAFPFHWPWTYTATVTASEFVTPGAPTPIFTTPGGPVFTTPGGPVFTTPGGPIFTTPGGPYYTSPTPTPSGDIEPIPTKPTTPRPKLCTLICANSNAVQCAKGWHPEKIDHCWSCCKDAGKDVGPRNMGSEVRVIW